MISIAIDGPAGAGKSTTAKALAARLGYIYVDTGALYRAIGLYAMRSGCDTASPEQVLPLLPLIDVQLRFIDGAQRIYLCGEDVSEAIRVPEASMAASNVSAMPQVREFLMELQRGLARSNNVIMDGRDIGTVVLPGADAKIFLTASPEVRAMRRYKEQIQKGFSPDYSALLQEIKRRDYNDSHREAAPLRQADDAWLCDTTSLSFDETVEAIIQHIKHKFGE